MNVMQLTTAQEFEQERMSRWIEQLDDPAQLRQVAGLLLRALMTQKAATAWAIAAAAGVR